MSEQMTNGIDTQRKDATRTPSIILILVAVILCVCYFLPFTAAKDDSIATNEFAQSYEINEGSGLTVSQLSNPSVITWARFYKVYCDRLGLPVTDSLNDYSLMFWTILLSGAAAVLALLFAILRKPTPTALFAIANLGLTAFISFYFETYGPVSSSAASNWAFGRTAMLASAVLLAAVGVWFAIVKRSQKKFDATA